MTHVLLAPAARQFTSTAGSESGWIFDIVTGLIELDPELHFTCVAETVDPKTYERMEQYAIGSRRSDEVGGAMLPFRIARATRQLGILDRVDLIHHGLPFGLNRTYSILALQAARRQLPFVVGPIQSPLSFRGSDEMSGRLETQRQTLARVSSRAIANISSPAVMTMFGRLSSATLRSALRVVTIDANTKESIIALGVLPERVLVIPPPLRSFSPQPIVGGALGNTVRVMTAGYLIERKSTRDVVLSVARLAADGNPIGLDVLGDGPELSALRQLAGEIPGGESIHFHGWLDRDGLSRVIRSAHVYVSMSRSESWGQAVVEAMSAGLVTISADNDGARKLAAIGAPIHLVGIGAVSELEAVLLEMCGQRPASLRGVGAAGISWVKTNLSVPVISQCWRDVYKQAIDESAQIRSSHKNNRLVSKTQFVSKETNEKKQ